MTGGTGHPDDAHEESPAPLVPEGDRSDHPTVGEQPLRWDDQPLVTSAAGTVVPALGLGTWQLTGRDASEVVQMAIEIGYRHIDTAQMYGNEVGVGRGIERAAVDRDDLFVTTKVANDRHEPSDLVRSVENSLRALDTDHVDLVLVHWPVAFERVGATMAALANVHAAGLARHIGVSNFVVDQLDRVNDMAPLEVLQVECHPFLQQRELLEWCTRHGWIFTAYSPIARGEVFDDDTLASIARDHDTDASAVSLSWLLSRGVAAIPKSSTRDHLSANWDAASLELTDDERRRIDALDAGHRLVDPDVAPW